MANIWRKTHHQSVSRRSFLRGAGVAAAGLAALATLPPGRSAWSSPAGGLPGPARGGRMRTPVIFLDTLDPHKSFSGIPTRLYNVLLSRSVQDPASVFFDLASEVEQPDDLTYIFAIRPGVRIAPNTIGLAERQIDATDAFASFQRIRDGGGLPQGSPAWFFVNNWWDFHDVPDPMHYLVRTPSPYGYFTFQLGTAFTTIPPRNLIQRGTLATQAAGGGPFALAPNGWRPAEALLDRNPNYYRTDPANANAPLPYVDGWTTTVISDRNARRTAFVDRQIFAYDTESPQEADELASLLDVTDVPRPVNTFISFVMNVKRPPWNDARIRRAAMLALDRQEYVDAIYKGSARANGLVHWPMGPFALPEEELETLQPHNAAEARALILEATGEETISVNVMYPVTDIQDLDQHLPIFLKQMEEAGFIVQQDVVDFVTWLSRYTEVDYDASLALNQIYDTPEIPLDFHHSLGPVRDGAFSAGLQDPAIDTAIDAAKEHAGIDELIAAVHDVQRQIYAAAPAFLPLVSREHHTLYWNGVKNVPPPLKSVELFLNDFWLSPELLPNTGDANCDGAVDSLDALAILQREAGLTATLACASAADVNASGSVSSIDAALILQHTAGLLPGLPPA